MVIVDLVDITVHTGDTSLFRSMDCFNTEKAIPTILMNEIHAQL